MMKELAQLYLGGVGIGLLLAAATVILTGLYGMLPCHSRNQERGK